VKQFACSFILVLVALILNPSTAFSAEKPGSLPWYEAAPRIVEQGEFVVLTEPMCGASSCSYLMTISHERHPGTVIFEGRTDGPFVKTELMGICLRFECQTPLKFVGDIPNAETPCVPLVICRQHGKHGGKYGDATLLEKQYLSAAMKQLQPAIGEAALARLVALAYYESSRAGAQHAIDRIKARLTQANRAWVDTHRVEIFDLMRHRLDRLGVRLN